MVFKVNNRYKASAIHFSFSLIIFSLFILTLLYFWYPRPYFSASGGWQGLKIVALVDIVLGPLLTLIVFNLEKSRKELGIDLSLIGLLQIAALTWGVVQVYQQRPVATVFWEDRFYTVPAEALSKQNIDHAILKQFSTESPAFIYAKRPVLADDWNNLIQLMNDTNVPPHHMPDLYRPIEEHFNDIYNFEVDIDEIMATNLSMKNEIESILNKTGTKLEDNHYLKLESRYRNIVLIFSQKNQLIGSVNAPLKNR